MRGLAVDSRNATQLFDAAAEHSQGRKTGTSILRFRSLDEVPRHAVLRKEKKVLFIEIECGAYWELQAEEVFELPLGGVVVVLNQTTRLTADDGLPCITLEPGTWLRE
jgi:hypothetical protein